MDGVTLPPAAAGNEALELALTRVLPHGARDKPVDLLQLPFRSVASDLVTGELVELRDTPLFLAMRASLAVPGVFAPVRVNQRLLVDGGLVRNLPVDVAREMGADIIIAVNVGTPLAQEKDPDRAERPALAQGAAPRRHLAGAGPGRHRLPRFRQPRPRDEGGRGGGARDERPTGAPGAAGGAVRGL
jgi:predicted acylesterase/phospholipase RssA